MSNQIEKQFEGFMLQMRGQDPNALINKLMANGMINQQQLNAAQQRIEDLKNKLENMKCRFGF